MVHCSWKCNISSFKDVFSRKNHFWGGCKDTVNNIYSKNMNYYPESLLSYTHHNEIVEEEDFSLVCCLFLGLVDISHLKKSTAAHQSSMGDGENLQRKTDIQVNGELPSLRWRIWGAGKSFQTFWSKEHQITPFPQGKEYLSETERLWTQMTFGWSTTHYSLQGLKLRMKYHRKKNIKHSLLRHISDMKTDRKTQFKNKNKDRDKAACCFHCVSLRRTWVLMQC